MTPLGLAKGFIVFISWTSEEFGSNWTVESSKSSSQYDRHIVSRREGVVTKQLSVSAPDFPLKSTTGPGYQS